MTAQPCQVPLQRRAGHDQQEGRFRQARDRQVALDPAARVQHLGIDNAAHRHIDIGPAHLLQEGHRIAPLDPDLAERGHVEEADTRAHRHMFGLLVPEPVGAAPAIVIFGLLTGVGEPVRPLPARNLAKDRAARLQMFMQRRPPHAPRGRDLAVGKWSA